ncbi:Frequency clock protein [Lachnellula subtilissima]|uniref:Frequency clock protein n=1 Tax=Lachnellula subtilissima TaxID=602034 RepID=A0A8H8RHV4_9HELO|nr:Frequency clock protein [Lachnellula subtilissima]
MSKLHSSTSNPRRAPAHLSVSLRHSPPTYNAKVEDSRRLQKDYDTFSMPPPTAIEASDDSNHSVGSAGMTVEKWFDHLNKRPQAGNRTILQDDESPFYLPHGSSAESGKGNPHDHTHDSSPPLRPFTGFIADTNGSGSDSYRSVIDDLTVQNKLLKEKLRRYEAFNSPHLEKDKLFEVKIHALPSKKRRELEDLLRTFASNSNYSDDGISTDSKEASKGTSSSHHSHLLGSGSEPVQINTSISSISNPRPVDSAYASISTSGPTSVSAVNDRKAEPQSKIAEKQNINSFSDDLPEGLLPRHAVAMTERQKKKLVVRRLEQLFTGKVIGILGNHNQPLQQQEVSKSALKAEQAGRKPFASTEGIREALIKPQPVDVGKSTPPNLVAERSNDSSTSRHSFGAIVDSNAPPEQRPTRPLDLDPDRAQVPADNVEYIRHLGFSVPQLMSEDSSIAEADAQGWIYLNLLISLAQLHIINVSPDFVRAAVEDVSSKFQLSRDGQKIRWRGGTEGSHISSDGDASSRMHYPNDSDSLEESNRKRRKLDEFKTRRSAQGRFASAPIQAYDPASSKTACTLANALHYRPLFNHHRSEDDSNSSNNDDSNMSYNLGGEGLVLRSAHLRSHISQPESSSQQRRQEGPIVFYNGAKFFTDLSGDRGNISTPRHVTGVENHGDCTLDTLGYSSRESRPAILRTPSGSLMQYRPFKNYSGDTMDQLSEKPYSTDNLAIEPGVEWSSPKPSTATPLMVFNASGLGGTRPADHFTVTVETRRAKLESTARPKPSRFSATGPHTRRFQHNIPRASLDLFRDSEEEHTMETLPLKIEVVSTHFHKLEPSELPAPTGYYADSSSSDEDSDCSSSCYSGISHLRRPNFLEQGRSTEATGMQLSYAQTADEDINMDDDDSDSEEIMNMEMC